MKLIENWKSAWKFWSVRLAALGAALQAALLSWPDAAVAIWAQLPDEAKAVLPPHFAAAIPLVLTSAAVVARIIQQKGTKNDTADQS